RTATGRANIVAAITGQQHAHMHLVALGLEPGEESLHPVPFALAPATLAIEHPAPLLAVEVAPRHVRRHATLPCETHQVVLTFTVALALKRLHCAFGECLAFVRHDQLVVDAHGAAETAAGLARPERRVE